MIIDNYLVSILRHNIRHKSSKLRVLVNAICWFIFQCIMFDSFYHCLNRSCMFMFTIILPSPKQMHRVQMHVIKSVLCSMNLGLQFFSILKTPMALVFLPIPSTWLEGTVIGRKQCNPTFRQQTYQYY
jgi:hypothetical protein